MEARQILDGKVKKEDIDKLKKTIRNLFSEEEDSIGVRVIIVIKDQAIVRKKEDE